MGRQPVRRMAFRKSQVAVPQRWILLCLCTGRTSKFRSAHLLLDTVPLTLSERTIAPDQMEDGRIRNCFSQCWVLTGTLSFAQVLQLLWGTAASFKNKSDISYLPFRAFNLSELYKLLLLMHLTPLLHVHRFLATSNVAQGEARCPGALGGDGGTTTPQLEDGPSPRRILCPRNCAVRPLSIWLAAAQILGAWRARMASCRDRRWAGPAGRLQPFCTSLCHLLQ